MPKSFTLSEVDWNSNRVHKGVECVCVRYYPGHTHWGLGVCSSITSCPCAKRIGKQPSYSGSHLFLSSTYLLLRELRKRSWTAKQHLFWPSNLPGCRPSSALRRLPSAPQCLALRLHPNLLVPQQYGRTLSRHRASI